MKKIFKKNLLIGVVVVIAIALSVTNPLRSEAVSSSELNKQLQDLINRSNAAKKQATAKKQEAALIEEQIDSVENDIQATENAINSTENQISLTEQVVGQLEINIEMEEENLDTEKNRLGQLIASWYMERPKGLVETLVGSDSVSEVVTRQQYFESIRNQISDSITKITDMKTQLSLQKDQRTSELVTLQNLKNDQETQKDNLESRKNYKTRLLSSTEKAIETLTTEAAEAEKAANSVREQLAKIFANSGSGNWGNDLISVRDSRYYYSQKSYPDVYMSPSRLTIYDAGCLVTSLAMIATYHGKGQTPPDIVRNSYFNYSGGWQGFKNNVGITTSSTQRVNWNTINDEIKNNRPVAVGVTFPGRTCNFNAYGVCHWIVIKGFSNGKYEIHDPALTNSRYSISQVQSMKIIRSY